LGILSHIIYYHEQHQLFLFNSEYFSAHLDLPGAITDYIASFMIQFFYHPVVGSVLLSACIASVCALGTGISAKICARSDSLRLSLLAPLFLLAQYAAVDFPVSVVVGILLNQLFALLFLQLPQKVRPFASLPLALALYFLSGCYCAVFISLVVADFLFRTGQTKWMMILFLAFTATLPFLGSCIYAVSVCTALIGGLPDTVSAGVFALLWMLLLLPIPVNRIHSLHRLAGKRALVCCVCVPLCYLFVAGLLLAKNFDRRARVMLQADRCVKQDDWQGVLRYTRQYEGKNRLVTYLGNLALYHTGQMPDRLFSIRQDWGKESLFFPWTGNSRESEYGDLVHAGLGYLNEAHRWTFEAMTVFGQTAPLLQKLVVYNIANERPAVAQRFINVLSQSLFYRSWAADMEEAIHEKRALPYRRATDDHSLPARFSNFLDIGPDLLYLCRREPTNRMASEYLMSYYLITNQVMQFAENLRNVGEPPYPKLPKTYDEALLIYKLGVPQDVFQQLGRDVQPETTERFRQYYALLQSKGDNHLLKEKFGDTYWYYLNFESPYGSKIINRK
jgi:hypothetical protein